MSRMTAVSLSIAELFSFLLFGMTIILFIGRLREVSTAKALEVARARADHLSGELGAIAKQDSDVRHMNAVLTAELDTLRRWRDSVVGRGKLSDIPPPCGPPLFTIVVRRPGQFQIGERRTSYPSLTRTYARYLEDARRRKCRQLITAIPGPGISPDDFIVATNTLSGAFRVRSRPSRQP